MANDIRTLQKKLDGGIVFLSLQPIQPGELHMASELQRSPGLSPTRQGRLEFRRTVVS